jgi:hypothetical protein
MFVWSITLTPVATWRRMHLKPQMKPGPLGAGNLGFVRSVQASYFSSNTTVSNVTVLINEDRRMESDQCPNAKSMFW